MVERAILQARQEADLVYNLAVYANVKAFETREQREREYFFLLGYLSAEMHGKAMKDRVQTLRLVVLRFLERVIILDTAIAQVVEERLNGQPVLFRDCSVKLEEQVQMAERASGYFNLLARSAGTAEIDLGKLRKSLQAETDRQISIWVSLGRLETLSAFRQPRGYARGNGSALPFCANANQARAKMVLDELSSASGCVGGRVASTAHRTPTKAGERNRRAYECSQSLQFRAH